MNKIAIFKNKIDAITYSDKVHEYLKGHRPGYNAEKWGDPVLMADGQAWIVKLPIEEMENRWNVPINTDTEKAKADGITYDLPESGDALNVGSYYLANQKVVKCLENNMLAFGQETSDIGRITIPILKDNTFHCDIEQVKALTQDADENIRKLKGNIKNYVADLTDGVRTPDTDPDVEALIQDGNIVITVEP